MTDRIQNLIDMGRLLRDEAGDEEVAGLWSNALEAFADASVTGISAAGRLVRAYDAGRLAAAALVRSRDLRVRAANHHEITLVAASFTSSGDLEVALGDLQDLRTLRSAAEYGWQMSVSDDDAEDALAVVRRVIQGGAHNLQEHRPAIAARIQTID